MNADRKYVFFIAVWDIKGNNFLLLAESEKADNFIFLSHKVVF